MESKDMVTKVLMGAQLVATLALAGMVGSTMGDDPVRVESPVKVDVQPVQFEYKVDSIPDLEWEEKGKELGKEGWELVFARRARDSSDNFLYECIFKRQARVAPPSLE